MIAVQKEAFTLAGLLTKVNVQTLAKLSMLNLSKPDIDSGRIMTNDDAENLTKPDIGTVRDGVSLPVRAGEEGFSDVTMRGWKDFSGVTTRGADEFKDTLGGSFATSTRGEFSDSIKKGSHVNAAPWSCASVDHSSGFLQPCRCSISRFKAAVTNCPVLSPGALTFSTASITSCGTRAATVWDLAFIALVAIPIHSSTSMRQYAREKQSVQHLTVLVAFSTLVFNTLCTGKTQESQITTPRAVEAAPRRLTKPLIEVTVMAGSQHTQTHPKFTWRFLALSITENSIVHITAATEREARDMSPVGCVMVFVGRLPVEGVSNVA